MTDSGLETTASTIIADPMELNAWNTAMTHLLEWYENPSQLTDEDMLPPSREIIFRAYRLALKMRDSRLPGPLRVLPDGEGGVVFERQDGSVFQTISIEANGCIEFISFEGSHLSTRIPITLPEMDEGNLVYDDSDFQHSSLLSESTFVELAA